ncbi:MAG TPA: calcium-binding protein [Leptolyngbyaceae cyanobacterium]
MAQRQLSPNVQNRLNQAANDLNNVGDLGVQPAVAETPQKPQATLGGSAITSDAQIQVTSGDDRPVVSFSGTAEKPNRIVGTPGNDTTLRGTGGVDEVFALAGNDRIETFLSDDRINAGPGNDFVVAGGGNDKVDGGLGRDIIFGDFNPKADQDRSAMGDDMLTGGAGDDDLYGQNGRDMLDGGDGIDLLQGGNGNDTLNGGKGDDVLYGQNANDSPDPNVEDNDILNGGDGNDYLSGQSGNDTLNGGNGDDTAEGGFGNDIINGDNGVDLLYGDDGADTIDGGSGKDTIFGGRGNDLLRGGSEDDEIRGELDNDRLEGGKGNDKLIGVDDTTVLPVPELGFGKGEKDTLIGNEGNDTFVLGTRLSDGRDFRFYNDGNPGNAGLEDYALITDFKFFDGSNTVNPEIDKIQLAGLRNNYSLGVSPISSQTGTGVFFNSGAQGEMKELIGIVQNVSLEKLNLADTSQFTFV